MWIVELRFLSTPARLAARPAHRDRFAELHRRGVVRMAGPLADHTGSVILVDVSGRETADAFLAADPYFAVEGVDVVGIRECVRSWDSFFPG